MPMVAFRFGVRGSTWGERRGPIWHARRGQPGVRWLAKVHPEGAPRLAVCHARATLESARASSRQTPPKEKFDVTNKSPVGDISAVTLIRTDTTLDHSQKAEKVCHPDLQAEILFHCITTNGLMYPQHENVVKHS